MVRGWYHIVGLLMCVTLNVYAQRPHAPTRIAGVINRYESVAELFACDSTVRLRSATQFRVGDEVLMIQMKGARVSEVDDSTYGTIRDINGAGCAEFLTVGAVNGDRITFTHTWVHPYAPDGSVQLVSVPRYTDAIVNGTVTAQLFNGIVGGVVVLRVDGVLSLQGSIDVSATGFRGGLASINRDICTPDQWTSSFLFGEGGEKGDGIATLSTGFPVAGRAPRGTGGGGGNGGNAGGAGGSNAGQGGHGGDANTWCRSFRMQGGYPGQAVDSLLLKQRIFLGGGGGGGHQNNIQGTSGGTGGGIVIVRAATIAVLGGGIRADGASAADTVAWTNGQFQQPGDGAGGGGAGGSVLLDVGTVTGTLDVSVRGGNGGMMGARYQPNGPGGGGGGGAVILATNIRPSVRVDLSGGTPGIHLSPETADSVRGSAWGATAGSPGAIIEGFTWRRPSRLTLNAFGGGDVCPGDSLELEATEGFMFYRWSNGATQRVIRVSEPGAYSVTAIDSAGCSQTARGPVVTVDPTRITVQPLVSFGSVDFLRPYTRTLTVRSNDDDTVVIERIIDAQNFTVADPSIFPLVLPPFDAVDIDIRFVAPEQREYNETMTVVVNRPCAMTTTFDLYAKVNPLRIRFSLPDTVADVGRSIALPLRTHLQPDTVDLVDARVQVSVRLDPSLFVPVSVTRGTIIGDMIDVLRKERTVTIELDSVTIPRGTSVLTEITGTVLLSSTKQTVLDIVDVSWVRVYQTPITTMDDGSMQTGPVCYTEGRAVRLLAPTDMQVGPSPAQDHVSVRCNLDAPGTYAIDVVDVRGRTVFRHAETVTSHAGGRPLEVTIPTDGWEQGAYLVRLSAPLSMETTPITVRR